MSGHRSLGGPTNAARPSGPAPRPSFGRAPSVPPRGGPEDDPLAGPSFSRSGAGAPLLLLHGLGSSRAGWDPVVPPLAEHFDVVAVDLPASGLRPPAGTRPASWPAW